MKPRASAKKIALNEIDKQLRGINSIEVEAILNYLPGINRDDLINDLPHEIINQLLKDQFRSTLKKENNDNAKRDFYDVIHACLIISDFYFSEEAKEEKQVKGDRILLTTGQKFNLNAFPNPFPQQYQAEQKLSQRDFDYISTTLKERKQIPVLAERKLTQGEKDAIDNNSLVDVVFSMIGFLLAAGSYSLSLIALTLTYNTAILGLSLHATHVLVGMSACFFGMIILPTLFIMLAWRAKDLWIERQIALAEKPVEYIPRTNPKINEMLTNIQTALEEKPLQKVDSNKAKPWFTLSWTSIFSSQCQPQKPVNPSKLSLSPRQV